MIDQSDHGGRWSSLVVTAKGVMLVAVSFLALGCPSNNGDPAPEFIFVDIENSTFTPKELTITVGQTVFWTNEDPVFHTVTSGNPGDPDAGALFDSDDLIPYDSFTRQFNEVGEFVYFSTLDQGRPGMVGAKITVIE